MTVRATAGGVVASAAALGLYARAEWPWFLLGWVGLVPWLAALDRLRSAAAAALAGVAMSVGVTLAIFGWFAPAIAGYAGWPLSAGLAALVVLGPVVQPQFAVFAVARHLARRRAGTGAAAALGAAAYVGAEWAAGKLFGDTLGHGCIASVWLRQAADVAGAPGLTFVLVLFNACAWSAVQAAATHRRGAAPGALRRAAWRAGVAAAVVLVPLAYGAARHRALRAAEPAAAAVTVGLVQADLGRYDRLAAERGTYGATRLILDTHFALSAEALGQGPLDLLLWPETVYPTTFGRPKSADGAALDRELVRFVTATGVPLLFGTYDRDDAGEYNAAVLLAPAGPGEAGASTYRKVWLFPLTERVPALLDTPRVRAWLPWLGTWRAGRGARVLALPLRDGRVLRLGPLICYDAVDPGIAIAAVRQGAGLLATLSNDSWFAHGAGPRLHLVVATFRSLETRRWQVRATNTGISTVITPTGEWLGTLDVHDRGVLVRTVRPAGGPPTLMVRWGDWFGPAAALAAAAGLLAARLAPRP